MATKTKAKTPALRVTTHLRCSTKPGARKMQAFFQRVRAEAKRFAQVCDMSPSTIAQITESQSTSMDDCTIFCVEPNDPVGRAQVVAALVHAVILFGGSFFYDASEDVGGMMTFYITLGALP